MKNIIYLLLSVVLFSCGEKENVSPKTSSPTLIGRDTVSFFEVSGDTTGKIRCEIKFYEVANPNISKSYFIEQDFTPHTQNNPLIVILPLKNFTYSSNYYNIETKIFFNSVLRSDDTFKNVIIRFNKSEDAGYLSGYIVSNAQVSGVGL